MYALRLEHRLWAAAGMAALGLLVLGCLQAAGGPAGAGMPVAVASQTVTVAPGDTLWGIAARRYPDDDVRARIVQIELLNDLRGPTIVPGQRLKLPAR